ncbi:hypothetical protein L596_022728 [Steinernema carpocapsae]|uniref:C-type lectin domain-containing protein n=1 Tax=Steinernema carpocapsae TaxID=34508 RepID=A0A4U5MNW9_STECR|nr:hypothetical protein L596_022728 [Steinernema carpocapsae]
MPWHQLYLLVLLGITNTVRISAGPSCPDNAIQSSDGFKCFHLITVDAQYEKAASICTQLGLQFASITNKKDNDLVAKEARKILRKAGKSFLDFEILLGGEFLSHDNTTSWESGEDAAYINYNPKDSYSSYGSLRCISLDVQTRKWKRDHCFSRKPFLCQGPSKGSNSALQGLATCPEDSLLSPDGSKCFFLVTASKTCNEASLMCFQAGLEFASIGSQEENDKVSKHVRQVLKYSGAYRNDVFLGGEVKKESKKVLWENGATSNYSNFKEAASNPMNRMDMLFPNPMFSTNPMLLANPMLAGQLEAITRLKQSNCVILDTRTTEWKDEQKIGLYSGSEMPFLCERKLENGVTSGHVVTLEDKPLQIPAQEPRRKPAQIPEKKQTEDLPWKKQGNFLYYFSKDEKTWKAAEEFCVANGAHLTSIHDEAENEFVRKNCQFCWIGGESVGKNTVFTWIDSSKMVYTNWLGGSPFNFGDTNCVDMIGSVWYASNCYSKAMFTCKRAV